MRKSAESIHWIKDKNGENHVCYINNHNDGKSYEQLSEDDKRNCYSEKLPWS